jgi:hypothetical protein
MFGMILKVQRLNVAKTIFSDQLETDGVPLSFCFFSGNLD